MVHASKGEGVAFLRQATGATAVAFAGDNTTDEDALGSLVPGDLGVKVGLDFTQAEFRVESPVHVGELLEALLRERKRAVGAWELTRAYCAVNRASVTNPVRSRSTSAVRDGRRPGHLLRPRASKPQGVDHPAVNGEFVEPLMENCRFGGPQQREHKAFEPDLLSLACCRIRARQSDCAVQLSVGNGIRRAIAAVEFLVREQGKLSAEDVGVEAKCFTRRAGETDRASGDSACQCA